MKRLSLAIGFLGIAAASQAFVNVNIDVQYQTASLPSSGTITVTFTGTIDVLMPNVDVNGGSIEFPYRNGSDFLNAGFHADFLAYVGATSPGVDFSGNLFTVDVTSSTPQGLYYLDSSGGLAEFVVIASNGQVSGGDNEFFGVNVVPEPASMAALGIGALALLRRRRR